MTATPARKRLTRAESMALTRQKLLASAIETFEAAGYEAATIDRIAENAGFSRGAFYAHFGSKIEIYTEALAGEAAKLAAPLLASLESCRSPDDAVRVLCQWTNERRSLNDVGFLLVEVMSHASRSRTDVVGDMASFRANWTALGNALSRLSPGILSFGTPEEIGAFVLELAHGAIVEGMGGPTPSRLVEIGLRALLQHP